LAAILNGLAPQAETSAIIISGANIDPAAYAAILTETFVPDRKGDGDERSDGK
jgi:threonine dehydratase